MTMNITIYLPLLVALIGAVLFLLLPGPNGRGAKWAELGRIAFFAGLLAFLLAK